MQLMLQLSLSGLHSLRVADARRMQIHGIVGQLSCVSFHILCWHMLHGRLSRDWNQLMTVKG